MDLRPLTDDVLLARLEALVAHERENVADIVAHLAEVDRREIIPERGFPTVFEYCRRKLNYSEASAFLRIRAARASRSYPRVIDDLRSGSLHLDAVMRLYPHMTKQNSDQLLDLASGASKREVLSIVARLDTSGSAPERDVIRPLPSVSINSADSRPALSEVIPPPPRVRLAFTADNEFLVMVERLRSLRRHKFPAGRLEDVLKEALVAFLERIDPDRKSNRRAPEPGGGLLLGKKNSRWIPKSVKAAVWKRDAGRCAFIAADGTRCQNRDFLEYDHIMPWALGGRSDSVENIRLLCRPHNLSLARRRFGPRRTHPAQLRPDAVEQASAARSGEAAAGADSLKLNADAAAH